MLSLNEHHEKENKSGKKADKILKNLALINDVRHHG